jgi:transcriptional regulator with XRE-family HTH domain
MDLFGIGYRVRRQRELLGYTREHLAELLDITPKFCSDIELGVKGMSVPTLIRVSRALKLPTDYILFGMEASGEQDKSLGAISMMLRTCDPEMLPYIESIIKSVLLALDAGEAKK